jgi:hypothetical protein
VPGLLIRMMSSLIRRPVILVTCAIISALLQPLAVLAHGGGEPLIHVPADHIEPGQSFQLIAADLGPNARVTLELAAGDQRVSLGTVTSGPDGHFETTLALPQSFPEGYAQLTATSDEGSFASAWVRVGAGQDLGLPPASNPAAPWIDPSLILVPIGAIVLFLVWRFRARARA